MGVKVENVRGLSVKVVPNDNSLEKSKMISERDAEMDNRAKAAEKSALDRATVCKKPVAKYDAVTKRAYVEYADGERKYVN